MVAGMERSMLAGLQQRHLVTSLPHLTPNLYEMAALTQELDTQVSRDNCFMHFRSHNTGLKLFCVKLTSAFLIDIKAKELLLSHNTDLKLLVV
jgi:hypothetical protein